MDKLTRHYRKRQIERVQKPETQYSPKIKIVNNEKSTNFMDISFDELEKIKAILTK